MIENKGAGHKQTLFSVDNLGIDESSLLNAFSGLISYKSAKNLILKTNH